MQDNCTKLDFSDYIHDVPRQEKVSLYLISGIKLTGFIHSVERDFLLLSREGQQTIVRFAAIASIC